MLYIKLMRSSRLIILIIVIAAFAYLARSLWPRLPENVERRHAEFHDRKVTFLVVELPHDNWRWELHNDPALPKTVYAWQSALGADVVFNAAYFTPSNTPAGFFKLGTGTSIAPWPTAEEQKDVHGYTFMLTLGVGDFSLHYLPTDPQSELAGPALLSFPTLVADGTALIDEDSGLYAARTMFAETADGRDYMIITEHGSVSLAEASYWLAQQPEHFVIAGNLDGGPSTSLFIENERFDLAVPGVSVPSVIAGYRVE